MTSTPARNAPCPCGSGKRYKDCHGRLASASAPPAEPELSQDVDAIAALEAHRLGQLDRAEQGYRRALERFPKHPDLWHMLGVVLMQQGRPRQALDWLVQACAMTNWQFAEFRHNLGLALGQAMSDEAGLDLGIGAVGRAYRTRKPKRVVAPSEIKVSVIIPSYNHGRFIEEAVESVFAQTYPAYELIVIDDGSTDDSVARLERLRARSPIPFQLLARHNQGAAITLNEGIALANGDWIQPLNSDDRIRPERIEQMLSAVYEHEAQWGFGGVMVIDAASCPIDPLQDSRVFEFYSAQAELIHGETLGESFLTRNPAISTGNLFFSKTLFASLGGFPDWRYHHDWAFALAAVFAAEPVHVETRNYEYRLHERNTISEAREQRLNEVAQMLPALLDRVFNANVGNPWAPNVERWGPALLFRLLSSGVGGYVPVARLQALAEQVRANQRGK